MQFSSIVGYKRHTNGRLTQIKKVIRTEQQRELTKGYKDAQKLLAGGIPKKELHRRGHPFARRHLTRGGNRRRGSAMGTPLLPINIQSAKLINALEIRGQRLGVFGVPYARFVLSDKGTRRTMGRGFRAKFAAAKRIARAKARIRAKIGKILST